MNSIVEQIKDKLPLEMMRDVTRASSEARKVAEECHKKDPYRAEIARDTDRKLVGLGFFLRRGAKADGLTDSEFHQLKPIADSLVSRKMWKPEALKAFD